MFLIPDFFLAELTKLLHIPKYTQLHNLCQGKSFPIAIALLVKRCIVLFRIVPRKDSEKGRRI